MDPFELEEGIQLEGLSNQAIAETQVQGSTLFRASSDFDEGFGRLRITKWTLGFNTNYKVFRKPTSDATADPLAMLAGIATGKSMARDLTSAIKDALRELKREGTLFKDRNNRVVKIRVDSIGGEVGEKQFRPHAHANISVFWYTRVRGSERRLELNYVALRERVLSIFRDKYGHTQVRSLAFYHRTKKDDELRDIAYQQKQAVQTRTGWDLDSFLEALKPLTG